MFGLGYQEMLVIGGICLLLFGPSQLPKIGRAVGQTIKEFRNVGKELQKSVDDAE
jgi:sec-independent protein translocase protein TatA